MNEEKLQEMFRHRMRYETIIALEEAGEFAAVNALIKIWQYEHLNLPPRPGRAERARFEIALFDERILELEFEAWIADPANRGRWDIVLTTPVENIAHFSFESLLRNLIVDHFMQVVTLATDYVTVYENVKRIAMKEIRKNAND